VFVATASFISFNHGVQPESWSRITIERGNGRRLNMVILLTDRTNDRMTDRTITLLRQPWRSQTQ